LSIDKEQRLTTGLIFTPKELIYKTASFGRAALPVLHIYNCRFAYVFPGRYFFDTLYKNVGDFLPVCRYMNQTLVYDFPSYPGEVFP
jgi:hypothetical protein